MFRVEKVVRFQLSSFPVSYAPNRALVEAYVVMILNLMILILCY